MEVHILGGTGSAGPQVHRSTGDSARVRSLLPCSADLRLGGAAHLLGPVLLLLPLLAAAAGLGLDNSMPEQTVLGLELLGEVHGVVDEGEAGGLAAAELGLEAEGEYAVGGAGVHLAQLLPDVGLGHGGLARVQHVHNHLPPAEQAVGHVLPGTNSHGTVHHGETSLVEVNQAKKAWS